MASAVIRGLSEETHAALEARARWHKRSTEAGIRRVLADAAVPMPERGPGTRNISDFGGAGVELVDPWEGRPPSPSCSLCARECRRRHGACGSEVGNGVEDRDRRGNARAEYPGCSRAMTRAGPR